MMKRILQLYENNILRYVFFGGCTTLVNLASFYILRKAGAGLNTANIISIILAILFAYVVNSHFVFRDRPGSFTGYVSSFARFIGARLLTMAVEVGGVWLLVDRLCMQDMAGKSVTQVIVLILNYIFSRFFVFRSQTKAREPAGTSRT